MTSAVRRSLKDRCTVYRHALSGINPFGGPKSSGFESVASNLPCRGFETTARFVEDDGKVVEVSVWKVRIPLGSDVRQGDVVTGVASRDLEVLTTPLRRNHILLTAREIKGPSVSSYTPPVTPPDPVNDVYVWSQADNATPTGLGARYVSGFPSVNLPTPTDNGYVVLAQLSSENDLVSVVKSGLDQFSAFQKGASTFAVGSDTYEYWITYILLFPETQAGTYTFVRSSS